MIISRLIRGLTIPNTRNRLCNCQEDFSIVLVSIIFFRDNGEVDTMRYIIMDLEMNKVANEYRMERRICKMEVIEIGSV